MSHLLVPFVPTIGPQGCPEAANDDDSVDVGATRILFASLDADSSEQTPAGYSDNSGSFGLTLMVD